MGENSMKLEGNDAKIISILLELGMREEIAKNPDAVQKVLNIASIVTKGIDLYNPDNDNQAREALSKIVDSEHRISMHTSSTDDYYTKDGEGKEFFDYKYTSEENVIVDVNENNQTIITEKEIDTWGYGGRNWEIPRSNINEKQYPIGPVLGSQSEKEKIVVIEDGVEVDYKEEQYDRAFVGCKTFGEPELKPNIKKGKFYSGEKSIQELDELGISSGAFEHVSTLDDVGRFMKITRNADLTTARVVVGVNDTRTDSYGVSSAESLRDGIYYGLPDIQVGDFGDSHDGITGRLNTINSYGMDYSDIHKVRDQEKLPHIVELKEQRKKEIENFRNNKETQQEWLGTPKLSRLAKKRGLIPGEYTPETVQIDEGREEGPQL